MPGMKHPFRVDVSYYIKHSTGYIGMWISRFWDSDAAVDLGPPPAHSDEQEAPVAEEFRRFAFEGVANELKDPPEYKEDKSVPPQPVVEESCRKEC